MYKIENYIDGKIISHSNNFLDIFDPSKGEKIGEVVIANDQDFYLAVNSSIKAQEKWADITPLKRSRIL